jgi:hypothetical protein
MYIKFWSASVRRRDHSEGIFIYGRIILRYMYEKQDGREWVGFIWLRL